MHGHLDVKFVYSTSQWTNNAGKYVILLLNTKG